MNKPKNKRRMSAQAVGAMTFQPLGLDEKRLAAGPWAERSRREGAVVRMATTICNSDDATLKARVKPSNMKAFTDLHDKLQDWADTYRAGAEMMESAMARLLVALSHWEAQQASGTVAQWPMRKGGKA